MDEGGFILDYIMPAGSSLAETNRVITHVETILRDDSRSREHVAPHRPAARPGRGHRGQHRRHHGEAEARPRARRRRGDRRGARQDQEGRAGARRRVPAAAAGHDRRPDQRARAGRDQAVLAGSRRCCAQWAPQVGDAIKKIPGVVDVLDGIENTISGPATMFKVDPVVAARAGFTPQEVELDASAILQGEPAPTPVVVNDRAYTIRVRFPRDDARHRSTPSRTRCWSAAPARPRTLGSLADDGGDPRPDRDPPREPAAQRAR